MVLVLVILGLRRRASWPGRRRSSHPTAMSVGNLLCRHPWGTTALMVTEDPSPTTTNGDDDLMTNPFLSVMCVAAPRPRESHTILSTCDHETGGSFHVAARSADSPLEIRFSERASFSGTRSPSDVALARSRVCCACAPAFEGFFRPAVYERSLLGACHYMRSRYY
ncbi:hypothetical protein EDB89DRAFT_474265 [Lactarius sanguifluus]|nr:hypothetical protein EDB89DRAFT_474265 [Lactarius sanguifluus]